MENLYREYLNVENDSENPLNRENLQDFICECEQNFKDKVSRIAQKIESDKIDFVLVSGPSSSGKTTFVHRLAHKLRDMNRTSIRISLDNYFLDKEAFLKQDFVDIDFESINAIDTVSFFAHMDAIIQNEVVNLPIYDFSIGARSDQSVTVDGAKCDVVMIEGLHALNDMILETLKSYHVLTIFLHPTPEIMLEDHKKMVGKDLRLLRRLVRDFNFRSSSVLNTFNLWVNVRRGETLYVYPESKNAEIEVDTTHLYEIGVLKRQAEELLGAVTEDSKYYSEALRLLKILNQFEEIDHNMVPQDSLLREFIG